MLCLEDITDIFEEGWIFRLSKDYSTILHGNVNFERKEITLYPHNCLDKDEFNLTVLHEILHIKYPDESECCIEEYANHVYEMNPEIVGFIRYTFVF